jgi:hypothetical protein
VKQGGSTVSDAVTSTRGGKEDKRRKPQMVVGFHMVVLGVVVSSISDLTSRAQPSQGCKMTKFSPKQHNGGSLVT